mmetsp:Transcript_44656/g.139944  ORF Transcript_44656/g.139944 Transcript_44656/m.139944 type:complete len:263 (-) Transcript_44656:140-928(-)
MASAAAVGSTLSRAAKAKQCARKQAQASGASPRCQRWATAATASRRNSSGAASASGRVARQRRSRSRGSSSTGTEATSSGICVASPAAEGMTEATHCQVPDVPPRPPAAGKSEPPDVHSALLNAACDGPRPASRRKTAKSKLSAPSPPSPPPFSNSHVTASSRSLLPPEMPSARSSPHSSAPDVPSWREAVIMAWSWPNSSERTSDAAAAAAGLDATAAAVQRAAAAARKTGTRRGSRPGGPAPQSARHVSISQSSGPAPAP